MNPMTAIVNSTAGGALTETANIATGDMGQIIIFFIAFALLATVVGLIYSAISKRNG